MNPDDGRARFAPVAAMGLAAVLATMVLLLASAGHPKDPAVGAAIAFGLFNCVVGAACFGVCRKYPRLALYVVILGNTPGLIIIGLEPSVLRHGEWAFITACWFMTAAWALAGMVRGRC